MENYSLVFFVSQCKMQLNLQKEIQFMPSHAALLLAYVSRILNSFLNILFVVYCLTQRLSQPCPKDAHTLCGWSLLPLLSSGHCSLFPPFM